MHWTEDMAVGIPMIDRRHRELHNRLNSLRAAIREQVCRYTIEDMLTFLEEYSKIHFCEEELCMKHYGYPDYASHKEKHEIFSMEMHYLREDLRNIRALGLKGSYELSVETVQIVSDWLNQHVLTYDRELGEFLGQRASLSIETMASPCGGGERLSEGSPAICSVCHKIRGNKGLWRKKEDYTAIPADIVYSHSICPECLPIYHAGLFQKNN